jgi:DHA2 family multidrug resistance protein
MNDAADERIVPRNVVEYGIRRTIVTFAVILATLLEIVDTTIVNVALPTIQGNLGANIEEGSLIVTGYIVANVVVIPLTPWLAERFGRRAYFFSSILIFTIASIMCGLSTSLWELVFWRIVQGAGGGGLISTSQAILRDSYPPEKQGLGSGIFALGAIVGPTIGPTLGGIITDNYSWQWVFFLNIPLGILAMILVWQFLRNPIDPHPKRVDAFGISLLAVGLGALQYVLDQGQQKDWFDDSLILSLSVLAGACLIFFLIWEMFIAEKPIVDLGVLRYRSVSAGSTLGLVLGVTLTASLVTLPQFAQGVLGFTATLSGEMIFMRAIAVMLCTPLSVGLATNPKVDVRILIGIGFLMTGLANIVQSGVTTSTANFMSFAPAMIMGGVGLAFTFVPLSLAVFAGVEQRDIPGASAFFNLARQLGGSVGTAILVTIISRSVATHQTALAQDVRLDRTPISAYAHAKTKSETARQLNSIVSVQATTLSYADASQLTGYSTLLVLPLVFLLKKREPQPPGNEHAIEMG